MEHGVLAAWGIHPGAARELSVRREKSDVFIIAFSKGKRRDSFLYRYRISEERGGEGVDLSFDWKET